MLCARPSATAFVRVALLHPHDKPARAILHEPRLAEEKTGSEKGRDLPEALQRMTDSRAATQPGWSEVKALVLTTGLADLSANLHRPRGCIRLGEQLGIQAVTRHSS